MKHKIQDNLPAAYEYAWKTSQRVPPILMGLIEETSRHQHAGLATDPIQSQFLAFLVGALQARRIIEVGVFTGITTYWMAEAAGADGKVIACDISDEYPSIGKPYWEKAGLADRIDLKVAPASESLGQLASSPDAGAFDFCYIDADKQAYDQYYELVMPLLRTGGVIAFDNMLLHGHVADPSSDDPSARALDRLNQKLHQDQRIETSFLPVCDGIHLVRKL